MYTSNKDEILKKGEKIAWLATLATILLAGLKALVGFFSGSILLIADAVHSAVDTVAIFSSWFGLKISQKKYTEKFPYGYFKAENFATLIASIFILYASYGIFKESYLKFFHEADLNIPFLAMFVPLFSAFISYIIAHYEKKVGKEIESQSLIANAEESKVDVFSSLLVFGGIVLAYFNVQYIESILGMGLALMILKIGLENAKIAVYSLMDANLDKELETQVLKSMRNIKGVRRVVNLKLRQAGLFIFAEVNIQLDKNLNVDQAHGIAHNIEEKIKNKDKKIENLTVHIEPFKKDEIKILIPVDSDGDDLELRTVNHFGRAEYFLFIVLKNNKIISSYTKKNAFFEKEIRSGLATAKDVIQENIDVVITKRIGEISFHTLHDAMIDVYLSDEEKSGEVIQDFIEGKLKKLEKSTHENNK